MSVKVVKIEITELKKTVNLTFLWNCENCKKLNEDEVSEMILLKYKVKNLGTMNKHVRCGDCGSPHDVRLLLE